MADLMAERIAAARSPWRRWRSFRKQGAVEEFVAAGDHLAMPAQHRVGWDKQPLPTQRWAGQDVSSAARIARSSGRKPGAAGPSRRSGTVIWWRSTRIAMITMVGLAGGLIVHVVGVDLAVHGRQPLHAAGASRPARRVRVPCDHVAAKRPRRVQTAASLRPWGGTTASTARADASTLSNRTVASRLSSTSVA